MERIETAKIFQNLNKSDSPRFLKREEKKHSRCTPRETSRTNSAVSPVAWSRSGVRRKRRHTVYFHSETLKDIQRTPVARALLLLQFGRELGVERLEQGLRPSARGWRCAFRESTQQEKTRDVSRRTRFGLCQELKRTRARVLWRFNTRSIVPSPRHQSHPLSKTNGILDGRGERPRPRKKTRAKCPPP